MGGDDGVRAARAGAAVVVWANAGPDCVRVETDPLAVLVAVADAFGVELVLDGQVVLPELLVLDVDEGAGGVSVLATETVLVAPDAARGEQGRAQDGGDGGGAAGANRHAARGYSAASGSESPS